MALSLAMFLRILGTSSAVSHTHTHTHTHIHTMFKQKRVWVTPYCKMGKVKVNMRVKRKRSLIMRSVSMKIVCDRFGEWTGAHLKSWEKCGFPVMAD